MPVAKSTTKAVPKTQMYLVHLQDGKDIYLTLVTPAVFQWLHLPYSPPDPRKWSPYEEEVPEHMRDAYFAIHKKTTCLVDNGSCVNDRAMRAPGESFDTVSSLMRYVKAQNIKIADEYRGHSY